MTALFRNNLVKFLMVLAYQAPSKTVGEADFRFLIPCVDGEQTEFSASGHLNLKEIAV